MFSKIVFFCAVVAFPLASSATLSNQTTSNDFANGKDRFLEEAKAKMKRFAEIRGLGYMEPKYITDNSFLTTLCENNVDGNYQLNTPNCEEFVMCSGGRPFRVTCPGGGQYLPNNDQCVYQGGADRCPWPSTWEYPAYGQCAPNQVGQRNWKDGAPLLLPVNPQECCGRDVLLCKGYKVQNPPGTFQCPTGFGYSKIYFACIEYRLCKQLEDQYKLA